MSTKAEENYLKAIYKLAETDKVAVSTNAIAGEMETSPASVTDMIKRLSSKGLVNYEKYKGATLSDRGREIATQLVRKHRLWETFLVDKLGFKWDEVHVLAEELEHIDSDELINRLELFLGHPKFDPHGDPIPSADGKFTLRKQMPLSDLAIGQSGVVVGVREHDDEFLRHLDELGIGINESVAVVERFTFDQSARIDIAGQIRTITNQVSQSILVRPQTTTL